MSLIPIGTPCSGPRNFPSLASASQVLASVKTRSRSTVTHASRRDSMRSITRKSASTHSTGDRVPLRMAADASLSERSSGFIVDVQDNGSQFLDLFRELLDLGVQLFGPRLTEFFLSCFLKIHSPSMVPFRNFPRRQRAAHEKMGSDPSTPRPPIMLVDVISEPEGLTPFFSQPPKGQRMLI